jgi:hypothetical protein
MVPTRVAAGQCSSQRLLAGRRLTRILFPRLTERFPGWTTVTFTMTMIVVVTEACPQSKVPARAFRPLVRGYQAARPSCDVVQSVWLAMGYPVRLATTFQAAHLHGWVPAESRSLIVCGW